MKVSLQPEFIHGAEFHKLEQKYAWYPAKLAIFSPVLAKDDCSPCYVLNGAGDSHGGVPFTPCPRSIPNGDAN